MITQYFDINNRLIIQAPGTLAPATQPAWVYGDNYNLAIYLTAAGIFQAIGSNDSLGLILFQPGGTLPETNLAIISAPVVNTDSTGFNYYLVNVNLKTSGLAALVQSSNKAATLQFHYEFTPATGERFSSSADLTITLNPDPIESAIGATPVPPGYPTNPNVFEQIVNKNAVGGYAGLDANAHLNPAQIPTDTTLHVISGQLSVVSSGGAGGNPYIAVIPAGFAIPAETGTVNVTLGAVTPDLVANQPVLVTDGTSSFNAIVASVSGTAVTLRNSGGGAVSGSMGANSHLYMGNRAGLADTSVSGLVPVLPTTTPTKEFFRGDGTYAAANYPDLTNVPATFPPAAHANAHLTTGGDPIPLATISAAGLCPPPDGSTIIISSGKLVSTVSGGGGNPYVATIPATFTIPAAAATVTVTMDAAHADLTLGASVLIVDGSHVLNGIVTTNTGTSLTVRNTGAINGAVSGTMGAGSHVYLGNLSDLASTSAPGISRPDGATIIISAGVLSTASSAPGQHGVRRQNSAAITYATVGTVQALTFDTQVFDTDTYYQAGQFKVPTGQAGYYSIGACVQFGYVSGQTYVLLAIRLNGVVSNYLVVNQIPPVLNSQPTILSVDTVYHLNVGDYVEAVVQEGGAVSNLLVSYAGGAPVAYMMRIS